MSATFRSTTDQANVPAESTRMSSGWRPGRGLGHDGPHAHHHRAPALILLAFAHERDNPVDPYRNLLKEQIQIQTFLSSVRNNVELRVVSKATVERLNELLLREGDRLVGFHLASDVGTLIEAREGRRRSFERAQLTAWHVIDS